MLPLALVPPSAWVKELEDVRVEIILLVWYYQVEEWEEREVADVETKSVHQRGPFLYRPQERIRAVACSGG